MANAAVRQHDLGCLQELHIRAVANPDSIVLLAPGRPPLTYAALWTQIGILASALREAGLTRRDIVAVVLPDGPELMSVFFGVASVATCAPVNPAFPKAEVARCFAELGATALIVHRDMETAAKTVAHELGLPIIEAVFHPNDAAGSLALHSHARRVPQSCAPVHFGETALLLQTSATTGSARLVPLTHSNLRAMAANTGQILELSETDRFLSMMPLFHLQGLMALLAQMMAGGACICTSGFDAEKFVRWLDEFRPTWYTAVPALHSAIMPLLRARQGVLRRYPLRFVRSIGAPLAPALLTELEAVLHAPVLEGYGMTETGVVTSNGTSPDQRRLGSVGKSAGLEVSIMGPDGESLRSNSEGQVAVRGPAVMQAYRNNREANRTAFQHEWFLTGDLGRLDDENFLFITGRLKEVINRGGAKVHPGEIENTLESHPGVEEAAAFAIPHATLGEDLAAAVVVRSGAAPSESDLRAFAAQHLPTYKIPRRIVFVTGIPKGPTGKPKRLALAGQLLEASRTETVISSGAADGSPTTGMEKTLVDLWARVLNIDQPGIHDNFFELGGDSLGVTRLAAELAAHFGVRERILDASEFFSSPTVATLVRILAAENQSVHYSGTRTATVPPTLDSTSKTAYVALQPNGSRSPFFCFAGADENPYYFRQLAWKLGSDQPFFVIRDPRPLSERGVYTLEQAATRFADTIRSLRQNGPYILAGHCFGGIVAIEVARQLAAAGAQVSMVILFEVPTPGYPKVLRNWRNYVRQTSRLMRRSAAREGRATLGEVLQHLPVLAKLLRRRVIAFTRGFAANVKLHSVIASLEQLKHRNEGAARIYKPKPPRCPVIQFVAADEHHSTAVLDDPRLGWREVAAGSFAVYKAGGKAEDLFIEPHVDALAAQVRALLDRANSFEGVGAGARTRK